MTTRWRPDFDPDHLYFVTTTAAERTHIFRQDVVKRILVDSLYYVSLMNQVMLYAFVIMPNHVHTIIQCPEDRPPKDWARAVKTGSARLIVRQYQVADNQAALDALRRLVTRPEKQAFKVWEDGYLAKEVMTPDFLEQKLAYTHNNPVQPHWRLVEAPEEYVWSSARFYLRDEPALIPLQDVRELLG
jgi:putative transposase